MTDMVKLGDVAAVRRETVNPSELRGDTSYLGLEDIERGGRILRYRTVADAELSSSKYVFSSNDVLYGKLRPNLGKIARPDRGGVCSTDILPIVAGEKLDSNYLGYYLSQPTMIAFAASRTSGANLPRISPKTLIQIQIPLPPLVEQRRIVDILDRADAIRAKRRHMLADFDELPRSLFERMFGNGDWNRIPLNQIVGNMQGGKNLVADNASAESVNRVLKISAVTSGHFRPEESKPLPDEYVPPAEHFVRDGDLLITRANTAEMVGAAVLVHGSYPHLVLPDKIWRFVWRDAAAQDPVYILWLLRTLEIRRAMSALSSGTSGSMKNISKAKLLAMNIPLPPISLQREFARRVEAIAAARAKVERALALDDELFASLQSRAFRGEL